MKIFHIAPYYPPNIGGLQVAVEELAEAQSKAGHFVTVITSRQKIAKQSKATSKSRLTVIRLFSIDIGHSPLMPGLLFLLLSRIHKGDVVHLHFAQAYVPEVVTIFSKLTGIPFVMHFHGDTLPTGKAGVLLPFYKTRILPFTLKSAKYIIFPSTEFMDRIGLKYPLLYSKSLVIPNGIGIAASVQLNSNKTKDVFLYVGRLEKVKNVDKVLDAFKVALETSSKKLELIIVGDGTLKDDLEKYAVQLNIKKNVHFMGAIERRKLTTFYSKAKATLLASSRESFGLSILESMSSGTPVIAYDAPGVRELIKNAENGFLVPIGNSQSYANYINAISNDSKLFSGLQKKAVQTAKQYNIKTIAQQHVDLYKSSLRNEPV